jgi:Ni,Fe-hydrogenase III small subunit
VAAVAAWESVPDKSVVKGCGWCALKPLRLLDGPAAAAHAEGWAGSAGVPVEAAVTAGAPPADTKVMKRFAGWMLKPPSLAPRPRFVLTPSAVVFAPLA